MKRNKKVWEKKMELLRELGLNLSERGFPARPTGHSFRAKTDFGHVAIHLNIAEYEDRFTAAIHVSVRFDEVQFVIDNCTPGLPPSERGKSSTVGGELGSLTGKGRRDWTVGLGADVTTIVNQMMMLILEEALPYFARFSTKEAVYEVLKNREEARRHAVGANGTAARVTVLAYLVGGSDEAERMIEEQRRHLSEIDMRALPLFERFVACFRRQADSGGK